MFERPRLEGTGYDHWPRIVVQTRRGRELENRIFPEAGPTDQKMFEELRRRHPNWTVRKPANGGYNCAGMVWASRRTCLPDPKEWDFILVDDGYRHLQNEKPEIGDIAVYRSQETIRENRGEILHLGRVCLVEQLAQGLDGAGIVYRILSKLTATYGEVIHAPLDLVLNGGERFTLELFTDRS